MSFGHILSLETIKSTFLLYNLVGIIYAPWVYTEPRQSGPASCLARHRLVRMNLSLPRARAASQSIKPRIPRRAGCSLDVTRRRHTLI